MYKKPHGYLKQLKVISLNQLNELQLYKYQKLSGLSKLLSLKKIPQDLSYARIGIYPNSKNQQKIIFLGLLKLLNTSQISELSMIFYLTLNLRINNRIINIFDNKKPHDYLENCFLVSVFPKNITPNQAINPPTKNLVDASGTIARIINPMTISTIPIVAEINSLFSILSSYINTNHSKSINIFGGFN
jgi:hypothetical protein